jgi:phosphatidylserine decarboxylase
MVIEGLFYTFNASGCSRFGLLPGSKHRAHSPAAWQVTRFGHRMPGIFGMDLAIGR